MPKKKESTDEQGWRRIGKQKHDNEEADQAFEVIEHGHCSTVKQSMSFAGGVLVLFLVAFVLLS